MNPPPERIHNWQDSQLSIARFYGGVNFTGCEAVRCNERLEPCHYRTILLAVLVLAATTKDGAKDAKTANGAPTNQRAR